MYGYQNTQDLFKDHDDNYFYYDDRDEYIERENQEEMEEISLDEIFNRYAD